MKSKKYILAIAGVLSLMQCVASYAGTWEQDGQSWKYKKDNGNYAEYEWVQDNGDWYYCSRWGFMEKNTVIDGIMLVQMGKCFLRMIKQILCMVRKYTEPVIWA